MIFVLSLVVVVLMIMALVNIRAYTPLLKYLHHIATWLAAAIIASAMFYMGLSMLLAATMFVVAGGILALFITLAKPEQGENSFF